MDAKAILRMELIDLLFHGRNKKYGAYTLRKKYSKRLWMALTFTLFFGFLGFWFLQSAAAETEIERVHVREVVLQNIEEVKPTPPPPPPPKQEIKMPEPPKATTPAPAKPKIVQPKVKTTKFTPPVIKKDKDVQSEMPPVKEVATVAVVNAEGVKADNVLPTLPAVKEVAAVDHGTGVVTAPPKKKVDENKIFEKVEIEASVNTAAWRRHLQSRLQRYIENAAYDGMAPGRYTVNVRFLVEKNGKISHVKALNNPGYGLARGAEQVVKTGPKWRPGEQNGRKVRSYHTQPITFMIMDM